MSNEEFHVNTPKKDGGKKKQAKYGWMEGSGIHRSLDAIFIAPNYLEALFYQRSLNYTNKNSIAVNSGDFKYRLDGIKPHEDLIVHLCGSWIANDPDEDIDGHLCDQLIAVIDYLKYRGFTYEEIPEIGKTDS